MRITGNDGERQRGLAEGTVHHYGQREALTSGEVLLSVCG